MPTYAIPFKMNRTNYFTDTRGSVYYSLGSYDKSASAWARAVYFEPGLLECVPEKLLLKVRQGVSRLRGRT